VVDDATEAVDTTEIEGRGDSEKVAVFTTEVDVGIGTEVFACSCATQAESIINTIRHKRVNLAFIAKLS
jgi:hypothetical protein